MLRFAKQYLQPGLRCGQFEQALKQEFAVMCDMELQIETGFRAKVRELEK